MDNKKIKMLYYGDGPFIGTGFGTASGNILTRLLKTGKYEIHALSINFYGEPHELHGTKDLFLYPMQNDPYGRNRVFFLLMKIQPDILFSINDYDSWGHIPEALQLYKEKTGKSVKWCFSPDTDIMTRHGIKNIKDLKIGDEVFSINPKTEEVSFKKVIQLTNREYNDDLVSFDTRGMNLLVTKDHKFYIKTKTNDKKLKEMTALEIYNKINSVSTVLNLPSFSEVNRNDSIKDELFPVYKYYNDNSIVWIKPIGINCNLFKNKLKELGIDIFDKLSKKKHGETLDNYDQHEKKYWFYLKDIKKYIEDLFNLDFCEIEINLYKKTRHSSPIFINTSDFFELLGWYISEGCIDVDNNKIHSFNIAQSKEYNYDKYNSIVSLIKKINLSYSEKKLSISIYGNVLAEMLDRICGHFAANKNIPDFVFNYDTKYLKILFDSLCAGDGTINKKYNKYCGYTSKSKLLIEQIRLLATYLGIKTGYCKMRKNGIYYIVFYTSKNSSTLSHINNISLLPYNGKVYCCTVEDNHTILAGRHGKFSFVGQCAHSPIDGEPIYPEWIEFIKRFIDKFVVVSKYGQEVISKTDPTFSVDQVYHGVDTEVFKKLPEKDIKKAKEQLQGKFCIVMVGTNQLRKQYPIALEAFTNFAKDKDDVVLLLHTQRNMSVGWNLDKLVRLFNISNKVLFTSGLTGLEGIKREELNLIYNIADVFLNTSAGEGFALPLMESMFAGAPVIYAANSSLPELIGDTGIPIPTDHYTIFPNRDRELVRPIPSSQVITEALNKLYNDRNLLKEYSQKSLDRTKELYDSGQLNWDIISDYFDKEFDKLLENKEEVLNLEEIL